MTHGFIISCDLDEQLTPLSTCSRNAGKKPKPSFSVAEEKLPLPAAGKRVWGWREGRKMGIGWLWCFPSSSSSFLPFRRRRLPNFSLFFYPPALFMREIGFLSPFPRHRHTSPPPRPPPSAAAASSQASNWLLLSFRSHSHHLCIPKAWRSSICWMWTFFAFFLLHYRNSVNLNMKSPTKPHKHSINSNASAFLPYRRACWQKPLFPSPPPRSSLSSADLSKAGARSRGERLLILLRTRKTML